MEMQIPLKQIKNWFLDMDGTLYIGEKLIPGTLSFLDKVRENGGRAIFFTNNSSGSPESYVRKLGKLGIRASEEDIFTSGDAAASILKQRFGENARCFLLGTPELEQLFLKQGFLLCGEEENPDFVLLGFDKTLTYPKIKVACDYIRRGIPFYATHPDLVCPAEPFPLPDTGSMIEMFAAVTGVRPVIIGKPEKTMADAAFLKYGISRSESAMVGDRLSTDIAFGMNSGIVSVLVLSGETTMESYRKQDKVRADYIFQSVKELGETL